MEALVPIFVVLIIVAALLGVWYLKQRRLREFHDFALQFGLEFSSEDPFGLLGVPFRLFTKGEGRGLENVLWGDWQGQAVRACDYWFYEESGDSGGSRSRTYHRFSCLIHEVPASFSGLEIARETLLSRLADHVGFRDIEFELDEFNGAFQVKAQDRKFAYDFIDARMMRWLLSLDRDYAFEVAGKWLLTYRKRVRPAQLVPLFGTARDFRAQIPRAAWSLYSSGEARREEA